jgi:hypothetical protein
MIDYLSKELKLYLPSKEMKASYYGTLTNINLESIMLSHVCSSAGYEQWKAMLISIENLLEDEQGLSMGGCWRWIFVNLEYLLHIGFDYDLQLTRH